MGHLPGRMGKQCRERWFNHLCPDVKKGCWTAEEDRLIEQGIAELGTRWCEIAKRIPGRTDNAIKNRYNTCKRRQNRGEKPDPESGCGRGIIPFIPTDNTEPAVLGHRNF